MANARRDRDRTVKILDRWMADNCEAYVGVVEVRGATLAALLADSTAALTATFEGSTWTSRRRRLAIAGRLSTLRVFWAESGEWIVRRWLVFAVEGELHSEDASQLAAWVDDRLSRRVSLDRPFRLRPVNGFELLALARHLTGCSSPLDPPVPVCSESIEIEFSESGELLPDQLDWEHFIEYAEAMEGESCWRAGRARRGAQPGGGKKGAELLSTDAWSVLVDEVRRAIPNPVYIEAAIKSDGRFDKK
jgi:hypothetical protein